MPYRNLSLDKPGAIRVLTISSGVDNSPIQLTITTAKLKRTAYRCLSYTWDPQYPQHDVVVNGQTLRIGHNLWLFLRSARAAGIDVPVWIDAICINQSNVAERNGQVSRMGQIYSNAESVIVWLGPLDRKVQAFFRDLIRLYQSVKM
jgi:hypothetical protein